MQKKRPISYFSKALSGKFLNKSTYEKELMALVMAVQHWQPTFGVEILLFIQTKKALALYATKDKPAE